MPQDSFHASVLPSIHPFHARVRVPEEKRHPMPRPTVPREQELVHATCDAMRCACPFPVYTKICIMLCPDASGEGP